jgi:hypothetical protein
MQSKKLHTASQVQILNWACLLSVAMLPLFVKWIFQLPRLMLQNFTDGVFYLGYAMHFGELVDRVGLNYYAVRFGAIFPDALAFSILGPVAGFSALRYGLAGLACVVLYLAFWRRFDSKIAGLFAAVAWAFNPAAIRLLQTGYVDVAGSFFLVIGVGLVLLARGGRGVDFLAGVSFGMAFWSHLHAGFALFFLIPLLCVLKLDTGWKGLLKCASVWVAGGLFATVCGVLFYGLNYGLWDITSPTREYIRLLTEEGLAARWSLPWKQVWETNPFWLIPIPLGVMLIVSENRQKLAVFSFLGVVGYIGFLFYGDFFKGGFSLSMFYYFSFVLTALIVFQATIVGSVVTQKPLMMLAFTAGIVGPPLLIKFLPGDWFWQIWLPAILIIVFAIGLLTSGFNWKMGLLASLLALCSGLVSGSSSSRLALGNYWKEDDIGLLAIGKKLADSIPQYQDDPSSMFFWYRNQDGSDAKMIQALFLHNFTLLQKSAEEFVAFGELDNSAINAINKQGIRHIIIIGDDQKTINDGIGNLQKAKLEIQNIREFSIKEKKKTFHVAHVILTIPEFKIANSLQICDVIIQKRASYAQLADGIKITTAPVKWNFDAFLQIPKPQNGCGLRLRFSVTQGQVYVGLFKNQEPDGELASRKYAAKSQEIESYFDPKLLDGLNFISIRNAAPNGVRSEIIIHSIDEVCE